MNSDEGVRALQETRRLSAAYFIFGGCTLAAENSIIPAAENCVIFCGRRPRLPKITQFSAAGLRPPKIKCRQTRILTQKKLSVVKPPQPWSPRRRHTPPAPAGAAQPPSRTARSHCQRRPAAPPGRRPACAARAGQPASPGRRCSVGR